MVRIGAAALPGFLDDRHVFYLWGRVLVERGPLAIYDPSVLPPVDYSPGYLYVLWAVGLIARALGNGAVVWRVLLEVVPIAGDLSIIALLYTIAKRFTTETKALILVALAAFAPPLWLDSAIWSQSDSVPIALGLLALTAASDGRFVRSWPTLATAIVVKPLVIVLAPTIAAVHIRSASFWRSAAIALVVSLAIAYALTLPFTTERSPVAVLRFLLDRYANGAGKAPFATEGGFSIYPLFTGFFTNDATKFGPLSLKTWGVTLVLLSIAASSVTLWRSLARGGSDAARLLKIFGAATLSLFALFLFATRMHERYLLPAIVFGSVLTLDDRPSAIAIWWLMISFSVNCVYSLNHFMGGSHHPITVIAGRAICALNLAAFIVLWQRQFKRLAATS